jgi:tRNA uridine 5-carboxymethylaminomethyl modification enzyme
VVTDTGNVYACKSAVITAGTFLRGSMIAGDWRASGARAGDVASGSLATSIGEVGIRLRRLKTGTPPRIDARSIDFTATELQPGSDIPLWFSRDGRRGRIERLELRPLPIYPDASDGWRTQLPCFLVHTNDASHELIAANADRSPMFNGAIEGVGPRYCPSIEDKVMRFRHKSSHGLFLEPEGWRTTEVYVQGANTSLPHDVQEAFLRTIPALREARITRYGYAVEYDAVEPTELTPWFASKRVDGLFLAGQVNGTSGYEEAAGQGLLAGVNAARFAGQQEPLMLRRDQGYIGVMADDLTTMDFVEPYRMLTSRAEHRLLLRADNADERLAQVACDAGLIDTDRYNDVMRDAETRTGLVSALAGVHVTPNAAFAELFKRHNLPQVTRSMTAEEYARRPGVALSSLVVALAEAHSHLHGFVQTDAEAMERAEVEIRYVAYVEKELAHVERVRKMEHASIPRDFDYDAIPGLRTEGREKLNAVRPATVGQAGRIAGVTSADIAVLLVHLRRAATAPEDSNARQARIAG